MMDVIYYTLAIIIAYLFGSVPWALVVGKVFYNVDVREHGSGNLGGTNAGRVLGSKAGAAVIILDVLKAFIVVTIFSFINPNLAVIAGMFASLGHCFPIFANFKGGKAVATNYGYILSISLFVMHNTLIQFVLPIALFIVLLLAFKMVSLSSVVSLAFASIISLFQNNMLVSVAIILLSALSIYRHKDNIVRIINKEEKKVGFLSKWNI